MIEITANHDIEIVDVDLVAIIVDKVKNTNGNYTRQIIWLWSSYDIWQLAWVLLTWFRVGWPNNNPGNNGGSCHTATDNYLLKAATMLLQFQTDFPSCLIANPGPGHLTLKIDENKPNLHCPVCSVYRLQPLFWLLDCNFIFDCFKPHLFRGLLYKLAFFPVLGNQNIGHT